MDNPHLNQANRNIKFLKQLEDVFPNSYYDWKITVLFYVAIHHIKALAFSKNINLGNTHMEIGRSINPGSQEAKMRIRRGVYQEYKSLFNYSRTSRYEGVIDVNLFEDIRKLDYDYCKSHLNVITNYVAQMQPDLKVESC